MSTNASGEALPVRTRVPWARPLAVAIWGMFLAATVASFVLEAVDHAPAQDPLGSAALLLAFGSFATMGVLIIWRRPAHQMGWIFAVIGALGALGGFTEAYVRYVVTDLSAAPPMAVLAAWFQSWYWYLLIGLALIYTPLLFPTGRPPSARWRPVGWIAAGAVIAFVPLAALQQTLAVRNTDVVLANPIGIPGLANPEGTPAGTVISFVILACILAACASVVVRFRHSTGDQRLQLKWFSFAVALIPIQMMVNQLLPERLTQTDVLFGIAVAALPLACGIAILKYRLYDIDLVINRTLVYGTLTAGVAGIYIAVVTTFDLVLRRSGMGVSLVATALVAVFFQPARERLQSGVDHLMYGERRDPYRVLSRLGRRLESLPAIDQMLPSLTETVAEALRLPYVAIELRQETGSAMVAVHGQPAGDTIKLPLLYQGEALGSLVVARRSPTEKFSDADLKLLEDLARQAGAAVNAVRLTTELQLARQHLVTAREEERRRLRRDLHDGLGPTLAGIGLQVEAARNLLRRDAELADRTFGDLSTKIEDAISDVRRLVYGLRPPALDELGLAGALQEQGRSSRAAGPAVSIETVGDLSNLPAAVEVAAYRIVSEALTNAARHSQAARCTARLELNGEALVVEIVDDGKGLSSAHHAGVGLHSIRERAAELGGACTIGESPGGGTRVWARLPCPITR